MSRKRKRKNPIAKMFGGIYKVLDKILVTPLSRIVYRVNKVLKKNAGVLESILNKPHSLLIASLLVAVLAFLLVDSKAINLVENESEKLPNCA